MTHRIDRNSASTATPGAAEPPPPAPRAEPARARASTTNVVRDSVARHLAGPARTLTRTPEAAGPAPRAPSADRAGVRRPGSVVPAATARAVSSPRPAPRAQTRVSPLPPDYRVPEGLEPSTPSSLGERLLSGVGLLLFCPVYLLFAVVALVPSLVGGAGEAPKPDQPDGSGTFMAGFANVFRRMMGWLNGPLYGLAWNMAGPQRSFFVDRTTDTDIAIITARIRLTGDLSHVRQVAALEDQIEAHMAIPGYRVNVEFVDREGPGVTTIPIDPTVWSNSMAWNPLTGDDAINSGDVPMIAHELLHTPLGLKDEYNLQTHFTNPDMGLWQRLGIFFHRLVQPELPADGNDGIMGTSWRKPLARHYEEILRSVG